MPVDPHVVIVFGSLLCALALSLGYSMWYQSMKRRDHDRTASSDASNALGVSELQDLLRQAVREATGPLEQRFDVLERKLNAIASTPDDERPHALPEHRAALEADQPETSEAMHVRRGRDERR